MLKMIFRFIKKCYFRRLDVRYRKYVTIEKNSKFYSDAVIDNSQKDKEKLVIGENTHIRGILLVRPFGDGIVIGDNCYIGDHTRIWASDKVSIGNSVLISHNVNIIDSDSHEMNSIERDESFKKMMIEGHSKVKGNVETAPIVIGNHAWISYNVCILKGVTIGEGAIVGAGSVVTKDVPAWSIVAGNPARVVKYIKENIK